MNHLLTALLLLGATAAPAAAQDSAAMAAAQDSAGKGWQFTLSPYLWTAGISGQVSVLAAVPPVNVNESFSDIWQSLDIAGMVVMQARNGRFGLSTDLMYIRTTVRQETPGPILNEVRLRTESKSAALLGEVLLYEDATNLLWASAGLRYWDVSNDVRTSSNRLPTFEGGASDSWVDPIIGARANIGLSGPLFGVAWAYVGGFGLGSDFSADLYGGLGYKFSPGFAVQLGYRWLAVDRTSGDFGYDVEQYGPMLGLTFRF